VTVESPLYSVRKLSMFSGLRCPLKGIVPTPSIGFILTPVFFWTCASLPSATFERRTAVIRP
jgi:hypothetical protein